jgi:hypothetical protein
MGDRNRMQQELTPEVLKAAIAGFEQQRLRIDAQIAELRAMLANNGNRGTNPRITKRRQLSAASRRKMALAQRARWARIRGESEPSVPAPAQTPKQKHKLSVAGRRAIQEAQRKRWAQKRAEAARAQATKQSARDRKMATHKAAA